MRGEEVNPKWLKLRKISFPKLESMDTILCTGVRIARNMNVETMKLRICTEKLNTCKEEVPEKVQFSVLGNNQVRETTLSEGTTEDRIRLEGAQVRKKALISNIRIRMVTPSWKTDINSILSTPQPAP